MTLQEPISPTLPYGRHAISEDDIRAVEAVLRGDWLTTGPAVEAFEKALAEKVGARFAVACSSGTAALHLAMLAAGIDTDDEVVVPAITFLATANAARLARGEVVFSDVSATNGLMTAQFCDEALHRARQVKAVVPVHLTGQCAPIEAISEMARTEGALVIEDACHAIGTQYQASDGDWVPVGACRHSDMAVFSFHPVKTVAMGEGGAITTNDPELYESLQRLRNHGMVRAEGHPYQYEMREIGLNYRASDLHCALGLSQLAKLDDFVTSRRSLVAAYDAALSEFGEWLSPIERVEGCLPAWHLYPVLLNEDKVDRTALMRNLAELGVTTQVHYIPVNEQPYYTERYGTQLLPDARAYFSRTLSLPLFSQMSEAQVGHVCGALKSALGES